MIQIARVPGHDHLWASSDGRVYRGELESFEEVPFHLQRGTGYFVHHIASKRGINGRRTKVSLRRSRLIASAFLGRIQDGLLVDHINGDKSDDRPSNLRLATRAQNQQHRVRLPRHNSSGKVGVSWNKKDRKWTASIQKDGKTFRIGRFSSLDDAIRSRKKAEIDMLGAFAPKA